MGRDYLGLTHNARGDYSILARGLFSIEVIKSLHKRLHKGYLGRHLGIYLGYEISKGYLEGYQDYLGRHLKAYLGYGIFKGSFECCIKLNCGAT